jgi:Protein of unknown function (DUF3025)
MPKSGQVWDAEFLKKSPLLRRFECVAPELPQHAAWPTLESYARAAETRRSRVAPELKSVRFVPPVPKRHRAPRTEPIDLAKLYDGRIALCAEVPCLPECFHDLFNVLAWSAFPRAKRTLHERQYRALVDWVAPGSTHLPGRRTREQDALTVFDEGGSVVVLSVTSYQHWKHEIASGAAGVVLPEAACVLFGHALMEHVLHGMPTVRSSALVLVSEERRADLALFDWLDQQIAARLSNASQFCVPGADAVVTIGQDGLLTLGAPS